MKKSLLMMVLLPCCMAMAQSKMKPIFNGRDLEGWTTYIEKKGLEQDPKKIFMIENGEIHVSGKSFAYMATKKSYKNFHLSLRFKWGEKKYPPREHDKRDAGICFYVQPQDKIWPKSIECQIQEGDVGDLWLVDSVTAVVNGERTIPRENSYIKKSRDAEKPHGEWNTVEVIAKDGTFTYIVNGVTVLYGEQTSVTSGRILLQSEGAELWYKDVRLEEL